jgi:hypothetical protein
MPGADQYNRKSRHMKFHAWQKDVRACAGVFDALDMIW